MLLSLAGSGFDSFPPSAAKGSRKLSSSFQSPREVSVSPSTGTAQDVWKAKVMGRAVSRWQLRGGVGRWGPIQPFSSLQEGTCRGWRGGPWQAGTVTGRIWRQSTSKVFVRMPWFPPTNCCPLGLLLSSPASWLMHPTSLGNLGEGEDGG